MLDKQEFQSICQTSTISTNIPPPRNPNPSPIPLAFYLSFTLRYKTTVFFISTKAIRILSLEIVLKTNIFQACAQA